MPYDLLFRTKFIRIAFKVFFNSTLRKWTLESLTIGPLLHRTDHAFWNDAFQNFPAVPHLKELTIIYCCKHDYVFDMGPWPYFNAFFCRVALFPQYMHVDLQVTINSAPLNFIQGAQLATVLLQLRSCQRVTFWGRRKWYFFFCSGSLLLPGYHPRRVVLNAGVEAVEATLIPLCTRMCS